jgi:hypothetical protein
MDEGSLRAMLDGCLLTDDELALGPEGWAARFEDELPAWVEGGEGEEEYDEWEEGEEGEEEEGGGALLHDRLRREEEEERR